MEDPPPPAALAPLPQTFRTSILPLAFVICAQATVFSSLVRSGSRLAWYVVALLAMVLASFGRQRLVVDERGVTVVVLRRRFVPWAEVSGFERVSFGGHGLVVLTASGRLSSRAPTSWWGGPATAAQVATLERIRQRQLGLSLA